MIVKIKEGHTHHRVILYTENKYEALL